MGKHEQRNNQTPPSLHALFTVALALAAPALRVQDVLGRLSEEVAKHA